MNRWTVRLRRKVAQLLAGDFYIGVCIIIQWSLPQKARIEILKTPRNAEI